MDISFTASLARGHEAEEVKASFDQSLTDQNMPTVKVKNARGSNLRRDVLSSNHMFFDVKGGVSMALQKEFTPENVNFSISSLKLPVSSFPQGAEILKSGEFQLLEKEHTQSRMLLNVDAQPETHLKFGFDPRREYYVVSAEALSARDPDFATGRVSYVEPENVPALLGH